MRKTRHERVMLTSINEIPHTLAIRKGANCKSCIYNSEHKGRYDGGFDCERYGTHISRPEECICKSYVVEPMNLENAIEYLNRIGWMQKHDKELTESRWIPCEERLPEKEEKPYLVYLDNGHICDCKWWCRNLVSLEPTAQWRWDIFDLPQYGRVLAWMPLPEPMK